ncbi:MAG: DUF2079 domain-containing protein [Polyangia bacterium]
MPADRAAPPSPGPPAPTAASEPRARRALALLVAAYTLAVLVAAYTLLYGWLCWRRYATFHAQIDLSYYLRLVWGLAFGHLDLPLVQCRHVIGLHLEPVLLPLVALRRLGVPGAPLLLCVQAAVVALLAWPAYRLGRRHLGGPGPALAFSLAALLYPTVTVATLHDFHPVTLALAPLLGVIDALDEGRLRRGLLLGALALMCREDVAVQLALLCLAHALWPPAAINQRYTRPILIRIRIMLISIATMLVGYFVIYLFIQRPYIPQLGSYGLHFAALPGGESARSGTDLLRLLVRRPWRVLPLLLSADRLRYLFELLWPLVFLPLLAPRALAGALPVLLINFLSGFPKVRSIESHYTTALVPFVLGAAVLGAGRLRRWIELRGGELRGGGRRAGPLLAGLLVAGTALAHGLHGGSPLALRSPRYRATDFVDGPEAPSLRQKVAAVPPAVSVAARPGPLAHLCERPRATSPPEYDDGQPVDVVLTEEARPTGERRIGNLRVLEQKPEQKPGQKPEPEAAR